MKRRITAIGIGFIFLVLIFVLFSRGDVEVIGNLPRKDVAEICRVVSKAEVAMEQPKLPAGEPKLSWRRVRVLPTCIRLWTSNRIVSITKESEDSVRVLSISSLWGQRSLRVEKRDGQWYYVDIIRPDTGIIVL